MIQRDYILRLTQQIAQLVAKLLGKSAEEKLEYIDEALREWLRLDPVELLKIDDEALLSYLTETKGFNAYQCELLAELLARRGLALYESEQFLRAKELLNKSLIIFGFVDQETQLYSLDRLHLIDQVNEAFAKC